MANTTIKITQLPNIGNNLAGNTLLPVVDTSGIAVTDKVSTGNLGNFILAQAGNTLSPAFLSQVAYSVANAAQPNITSVGNLINLTVNDVATLHIGGGQDGYVLQTDGTGNLNWTAQAGAGNGSPGGANQQIQYNNGGLFGGSTGFTFDKDANVMHTPGSIIVGSGGNTGIIAWGPNTIGLSSDSVDDLTGVYLVKNDVAEMYSNTDVQLYSDTGNNGYAWTFNRTGNLVLPTNTSSINYANGHPYGAQTGNIGFTGDAIYDLHGIIVENADLSHGATAALILPDNGNATAPVQLTNTYGNIKITTGITAGSLKNWTFDNTGTLTFPLVNSQTYIQQQRYGMGNLVGYNDGGWVIGEYNGTSYGTEGIRIDPAIEGNTGITLPGQTDSVSQPVTIYSTGGSGIQLYTGSNNWSFNSDGSLTFPSGAGFVKGDTNQLKTNDANTSTLDIRDSTGRGFYTDDSGYTLRSNGSQNWKFQTDGNLILPTNTSSINYANGHPYGGGGSANTGNILFNDTTIYANNSSTANHIYLSYNGEGYAFLDLPSDSIASTTNARLVNDAGNVQISTGDFGTGSNVYNWVFDNTGNLNIPGPLVGPANNELQLYSNTDILLQAKDRTVGESFNGGRLFLYGGQGSTGNADHGPTGGGYTRLYSGSGGAASAGNTYGAGSGGYMRVRAGGGGDSSDVGQAGSGGYLQLRAGSAGYNNGNIDLGNQGGDVTIEAGYSTGSNQNGGWVYVNTGGTDNGFPGAFQINIPSGSNVPGPGNTPGGTWTFDGSGNVLSVPQNAQIFAPSAGNITVGAAGNTFITSSDYIGNTYTWQFGSDSNLTVPGNINAAGNTIFAFDEGINNITTGNPTVVVTLYNNVFGDPIRGQVVISNVNGTIQANGTWYYQAVETNQFQLYTDSSYNTPVDGTTWTTYAGGGLAVTTGGNSLGLKASNITIDTGSGNTWTFNPLGKMNVPAGGHSFGQGVIQSANGYPTLLAYGSGGHGGPEIDFYVGDDPNNLNDSNYIRHTMYLNGDGLFIGMNENGKVGNFSGGWTFDPVGGFTLPSISTGGGTREQSVYKGQRKTIPSGHYSAFVDGTTPTATVVYTATDNSIVTLKGTITIQHAGQGYEMFDVSAIRDNSGSNVLFTVSNRLNSTGGSDTTVLVDINGGGIMQITLTVNSGSYNNYITYNMTEFGIPND